MMKNIFNEEVGTDTMSEEYNSKPLALVSVKQIIDKQLKFFVPAYQRGYRWRPAEVEVLIGDLDRFMQEEDEKSKQNRCPFYSLQSVVVKNCESGQLEVIDGQQRLTTLLIILQALHTIQMEDSLKVLLKKNIPLDKEDIVEHLFEIKYETRKESDEWLYEITKAYMSDICSGNTNESDRLKNTNSDYYHFIEAYIKSIELIKGYDNKKRYDFGDLLTNKTRFIWYNTSLVDSKDNEVDVFDRINATKIELNNAELIKALLLQKDNYGTESQLRDQMAIDWDKIEKRLQDPSFWGFVYSTRHPYHYSTHIEYIFDMLQNKTKDHKDYYYYTFNSYYKEFPQNVDERLNYVKDCWKSILETMLMLEEWYSDRTCYHYIGYLLEYGKTENNENITIPYLKNILVNIPKNQRTAKLKELVKQSLKDITPNKLFHGNGTGYITQLLFLLNIQSEQNRKSETARFSFASYKQIKVYPGWNEEHVASDTVFVPKYEDREGLAYALFEYFTGVVHSDEMEFDDYKSIVKSMYPSDKEAMCTCDKIWYFFEIPKSDEGDEKLRNCYLEIMNYFDAKSDEAFKDDVNVSGYKKNEKDFIWNFALLNATTNKSYGNDIYPLKRKRIMSDEYYIYTPICTRALFEKAYSKRLSNLMIWGRSDAKDYWTYICNCLSEFLPINFNIPFEL